MIAVRDSTRAATRSCPITQLSRISLKVSQDNTLANVVELGTCNQAMVSEFRFA